MSRPMPCPGECCFVEEQEPSGRLIVGPCLGCGTSAMDALAFAWRLQAALAITSDDCGRIMHEAWARTKRAQGFHHPTECEHYAAYLSVADKMGPIQPLCVRCHADLIPWEQLPERQQDINRHAFDDVLAEIRRRAGLTG